MNNIDAIDWSLLRSFLAVADHGNLSAAAGQLGTSQPTVSRHITELERILDRVLFRRSPGGRELTDAGQELIADVRRMGQAADSFARVALGQKAGIAGPVRITASEIIGALVLPAIAQRMREAEPDLEIEIVASNTIGDLMRRDADIAIRMMRPHQLDLAIRHVADVPLVTCASRAYFERRGKPQVPENLSDHDLIGFDQSDAIISGFAQQGIKVQRSVFKIRSDNHLVLWEALRSGSGIGFAHAPMVSASTDLESCLETLDLPTLPIYLAMHTDLRHSPRMRFVSDFLFDALRAYARGAQSAA
ncbi:molybdate transport repressor ModE-like protein [Hoeflea marina]|uniref:Molybdate transport repressor ModE-like protein n=1 Tax=Hoeflea marina TaxID=274592 RepID=A0A317PPY5_9HYPH|nr:molybdate transport repressor ModE-like protein [Hoeflea marina]